jgi:Family of unknown function (DUF5335)
MSTTTRELERAGWPAYFDSIASSVEGMLATIELMGEQLGDQTDVERLPVQAIGYDPRDDVLEVAVGGRGTRYPVVLRHFISNPTSISVEEPLEGRPSAILVTDPAGVRTLIRLLEPGMLEA